MKNNGTCEVVCMEKKGTKDHKIDSDNNDILNRMRVDLKLTKQLMTVSYTHLNHIGKQVPFAG